MKTKKFYIIIVIIIALAFIIISKLNFSNSSENTSRNPLIIGSPIGVNVKVLSPSSLQNKIFTNGTLMSSEEVELRSEASGKIIDIFFEEGKKVKKGALLLKINDAELQATLKKNKIREELSQDKEFRARQLLEKKLISQQDYDVTLNELNSVRADIEFTEAQIAKTEIRAPFNGVVGLRSVSVGSYITPQSKVANLQSLSPIKIEFSVPQKYYTEVKDGKEIEFNLPNDAKIYTAKIYATEPKIEQNTRTLLIRAITQNQDGRLTPGAYVEIYLILENIQNTILIPSSVIVPDIQGEKVFIYKNGKAITQMVTTGIRTDESMQITSGLNFGDTLITSGIIQLRPNSSVKINSFN